MRKLKGRQRHSLPFGLFLAVVGALLLPAGTGALLLLWPNDPRVQTAAGHYQLTLGDLPGVIPHFKQATRLPVVVVPDHPGPAPGFLERSRIVTLKETRAGPMEAEPANVGFLLLPFGLFEPGLVRAAQTPIPDGRQRVRIREEAPVPIQSGLQVFPIPIME